MFYIIYYKININFLITFYNNKKIKINIENILHNIIIKLKLNIKYYFIGYILFLINKDLLLKIKNIKNKILKLYSLRLI